MRPAAALAPCLLGALVCLPAQADPRARPVPPPAAPAATPRALGERRFVFDDVAAPGLRARRVTVVVPRAYDREPARRFGVVYAHDGQVALEGGLDLAAAVDELAARRAIAPWIVVAVDTTQDRTAELTTRVERTSKLVFEVVKGLVDASFRTRPGPEDTALVGYSYGGLATLRMALRHPDRARRIVCMSSSFWWSGRRALQELSRYQGRMPERLWIDVGTRESGGRPIPYMMADARAARDLAVRKGMVLGRNLAYLEEAGAEHGHTWGGLRTRRALAFALR